MSSPLPIADVHSHLQSDVFDADRSDVIERARSTGIRVILLMGEDPEDNDKALEIAQAGQVLRPCLGFHPDRLDGAGHERALDQVKKHRDQIAAIGEVGLDFWKAQERPDRERQEEIFLSFIGLARELHLPLSVHSRSAGKKTIDVLESAGADKVCMHAFDGKASYALDAVERLGYFFSIPASVVRSRQKQKLAARLPLSHLLLETDSPVLGPEAGARNEPANIVLAAEEIARIKDISTQEVLEAAWENTHRLFTTLKN